jgi:hypothetical protein
MAIRHERHFVTASEMFQKPFFFHRVASLSCRQAGRCNAVGADCSFVLEFPFVFLLPESRSC